MARKSKRMKLNEAIRQGQAKIAEGLKTGQMRADNVSAQASPKSTELPLDNVAPGRAGFLKSKKKSTNGGPLSHKAKLILLSCTVALVLGVWLVAGLINSEPSVPSDSPATPGLVNKSDIPEKKESAQEPVVRETNTDVPPPVVSTGDNVIWITQIEIDRQKELVPLKVFFDGKGIPTEIIGVGDRAALITKVGFERNPAARGTEGYGLLQQIKQLGPVYVQETEDTKFGIKPFQDAYGYKR